jgi:UMF1 family MFS transporter
VSSRAPSHLTADPGRRARIAWCLYDWGNSAFPAVILTFVFAAYFTRGVATDPVTGTAQWGWAISLSALAIAVFSPLLGAIADRGGRRLPWLMVFSVLCIGATAALWWVAPSPQWVVLALVLVGIANFGFELATVFYNALLPEIVAPSRIGRLSGWGWGLGYAGGLVCLVVVLVGFVQADPAPFGLDRAAGEHVRIAGPIAAAWFALFALPLFVCVPDRPRAGLAPLTAAREGIAQLVRTVRDVRHHRAALRFLIDGPLHPGSGGRLCRGAQSRLADQPLGPFCLGPGGGGFPQAHVADRLRC